jgi:hypothetical protein
MEKASATATKSPSAPRPLVPPDEQFWKHYSPHHEAPLSGVTSLAVHLLLIPLLLLAAWVATRLGLQDENRSAEVDVIRIAPNPGGGGSRTGVEGGGPNDGSKEKKEESGGSPDEAKKPPPPMPDLPDLTPAEKAQIKVDFPNDPDALRVVSGAKVNSSLRDFFSMSKDLRQALRKATRPAKGKGGTGTGGGEGSGTGKGVGNGPDSGTLSQREKRQLRWHMSFRTQNGQDYVNQLHALGAYVVLPLSDSPPRFQVIRDLRHPDKGKEDDISALNRMYWTDARPESVAALCQALGIKSGPSRFYAFFPIDLENTLLKREMAYLHGSINRGTLDRLAARLKASGVEIAGEEDLIQETRFDVFRSAGGYAVRVREVILRQQ